MDTCYKLDGLQYFQQNVIFQFAMSQITNGNTEGIMLVKH